MGRLAIAVLVALTIGGCGSAPLTAGAGSTTPSAGATSAAAGRSVGFAATDGVRLSGRVFGTGTTAVVLSNMGDNDPGPWEHFAPLLAARGYTVLTYSYRYPLDTASFTPAMAAGTVPDLEGAIAYARAGGAQRLVLVGASLGGITVGKVAGGRTPPPRSSWRPRTTWSVTTWQCPQWRCLR